VAHLVAVLRYKLEGREFDSRWSNPFRHPMAPGLTQPLTEISTRGNSCGGKSGLYLGLKISPPSCTDFVEIL
jgi:hypothetical protein